MSDPQLAGIDARWLQDAMTSFNETAKCLERAYRDLEREKRRIDHELERKNDELERAVSELDDLLDSMPAGVVSTDAQGVVRTLNPAAESMLGIAAAEGLGRAEADLVDARGDTIFATCDESDGSVHEVSVALPNGVARRLRVATTSLRDREARGGGAMRMILDVTTQRELEESLAQRDRMAEMGEMASVLAHQIRNPLNGIAGFGSLIVERIRAGRPDDVERYAEKVISASRKLEHLVSELLRFTRVDRPHEAEVDVASLVRNLVEELAGESPLPSASIVVATHGVETTNTTGDAALLREALRNLIENARDAVSARAYGDPSRGSVRVGVRRDRERVVVRIHDDGPGLDDSVRQRVFHPFFTTKESGFGLGMPIARKIIEQHGGSLTLRSRPGSGCRVRVELPSPGLTNPLPVSTYGESIA